MYVTINDAQLCHIHCSHKLVWWLNFKQDFYCSCFYKDLDDFVAAALQFYGKQNMLDNTPITLNLEKDNDPRLLTSPLKFPGKLAIDVLNNRLFISDSNHNRIVSALSLSLFMIMSTWCITVQVLPNTIMNQLGYEVSRLHLILTIWTWMLESLTNNQNILIWIRWLKELYQHKQLILIHNGKWNPDRTINNWYNIPRADKLNPTLPHCWQLKLEFPNKTNLNLKL